jgi:hypothetical protein
MARLKKRQSFKKSQEERSVVVEKLMVVVWWSIVWRQVIYLCFPTLFTHFHNISFSTSLSLSLLEKSLQYFRTQMWSHHLTTLFFLFPAAFHFNLLALSVRESKESQGQTSIDIT